MQIPVTSRLDGPISTSYDVWMPSQQKDLVQLVHQKYSLIHLSKTIGESSWSLDCDVSMEEITGSTARRAQMREQELKASFSPFTRRFRVGFQLVRSAGGRVPTIR